MTPLTDDARIAEIEARLKAASAWPWRARAGDVKAPDGGAVCTTWTSSYHDAALIASAPADLRYLLDRLRAAEGRVATFRDLLTRVAPDYTLACPLGRDVDAALREVKP